MAVARKAIETDHTTRLWALVRKEEHCLRSEVEEVDAGGREKERTSFPRVLKMAMEEGGEAMTSHSALHWTMRSFPIAIADSYASVFSLDWTRRTIAALSWSRSASSGCVGGMSFSKDVEREREWDKEPGPGVASSIESLGSGREGGRELVTRAWTWVSEPARRERRAMRIFAAVSSRPADWIRVTSIECF